MAASNSGASRVEPCSGRAVILRAPSAWPLPPMAISSPAGGPDGRRLASGSNDHTTRLWEAQEGRTRLVLSGHSGVVEGLAFTSDSGSLLSGSEDGTLRLWDVQRGEPLRVLQGYTAALYDLDWRPDGTAIASAGFERLVSLWPGEGL